ncbi:hypothetical protein K4I05_1113 [Streptococcus sanguinis]|nr:hypothetical protein [Streptococcus sanguinis]
MKVFSKQCISLVSHYLEENLDFSPIYSSLYSENTKSH